MQEVYLTPDGKIYETIQKVYLSDDKSYYSSNYSDVSYYNKYGIKNINNIIPKNFELNFDYFNFSFRYGEINPSDNTVSYELEENKYFFDDDLIITFDIKTDKIVCKEISTWNRCSELFEDINYISELNNFEKKL